MCSASSSPIGLIHRIISYTISYYLVVEFKVDIDTIVLLENATTLQQITVVIGWHKENQ